MHYGSLYIYYLFICYMYPVILIHVLKIFEGKKEKKNKANEEGILLLYDIFDMNRAVISTKTSRGQKNQSTALYLTYGS